MPLFLAMPVSVAGKVITDIQTCASNGSGRDSPLRENDAFRFGTEHGDTEYGNRYGNNHDRQGLGIVAAPSLGQARLYCCISGGEKISKLIGKTWKRAPSIRRREFVQVNRNYTPGALDQKLHPESPDCQPEWTGRERPERNDRQCQQCRNTDCSAPAYSLGERPKTKPPEDGANVIDDSDRRHCRLRELALHLEKGWIKIL